MRFKFFCGLLIAATFGFLPLQKGDTTKREPSTPHNTLSGSDRARININRFSSGFYNNGGCDIDVKIPGAAGGYYPRGAGISCIFTSGLMWGAHAGVGGPIQIGGSEYLALQHTALQPGKIVAGVPEDPALHKNRLYRVRPDIPPGNFAADISAELGDAEGTSQQIYSQYHTDWLEWPWQDGAPYVDVDHDGTYNPQTDIPGVDGADQTLWYVANDMFNSVSWPWGASVGIEMQQTVWAYSRIGPLGNTIFRRSILINKGRSVLDSLYFGLFVDPDLGDPGDDLVGCDTSRSMTFVYNNTDVDNGYSRVGLPPPAVGFDFFQGPVVPGSARDSAIFLGRRVHGMRNLPMTASYVFVWGDDPSADAAGIPQWYDYLRGRFGKSGQPYIDPTTGTQTTFPYSGDPVRGTGWLDKIVDDKRFGLCSGPVRMAPGDTQEVVIGEIGAGATPGVDRLAAVSLLRSYDDKAQIAYDNFFHVPTPPSQPKVLATPLNGEILLDWEDDPAAVAATEQPGAMGYTFQGYNVYQFPSPSSSIDQGKRLLTFDVIDGVKVIQDSAYDASLQITTMKVLQIGSDSGIKRYVRFTTDPFNSDRPLVNGTKYYYAVTAYNYNPAAPYPPCSVESPPVIITITPHTPDPGTRYSYSTGDTVRAVTDIVGINDAVITPVVSNVTRQLGQTYSLRFDTATSKYLVWTLTNDRTGVIELSKIKDVNGADEHRVPGGGFSLYVGMSSGMQRVVDALSGESLFAGTSTNRDFAILSNDNTLSALSGLTATNGRRYEIRFGSTSYAVRLNKGFAIPLGVIQVPFSVWDVGRTAGEPEVQMIAVIEKDITAGPGNYDISKWEAVRYTVQSGGTFYRTFDSICISSVPYPKGTNDSADVYALRLTARRAGSNQADTLVAVWKARIANRDTLNMKPPPLSTIIRFVKYLEAREGDVKRIAPSPATIGDVALAKEDVQQINVFPNPYYGVNPHETSKYVRFVTFSHLPQRAVIRIFNLAGVMVRKIDRLSSSQFEQWDLKNQDGLPVGSGLYIAHIEMPDLGTTKVLKLAIVQEQQILDSY